VVAFAALAAAASDGPSALFIRGNGLYGDGRYAEAAAAYEQILATGVESGPVLYNLGNAYLKAGDLGRAVLAYERALRLMPADPDLRANLGFARERAGDAEDEPLLQRLLFPLADRATTDALALAAAVAWWVLMGALALAALRPALGRSARATALVSGLVVLLTASSALGRWWTVERPRLAVLLAADAVPVRAEPSPTGTALFPAMPGTVLRVERRREAWAQIASRDGRRGWMPIADLGVVEREPD
jgi:tetratricopeptide (TPR) repeat protein